VDDDKFMEFDSSLFDNMFDLSDDVLASIPLPDISVISNVNNLCANSVFNNCTINFGYKKDYFLYIVA
jgi:hypothetical protein